MTGWCKPYSVPLLEAESLGLCTIHWAEWKHLMWAGGDPFSNTVALLDTKRSVKNVKEQLHSCLWQQERFGSLQFMLQRRKNTPPSPPGTPAKLGEKGNKRIK